MDVLRHSTNLSIWAQAVSALFAQKGLWIKEPKLLVHTLRLELLVTAIQFTFYVALLRNIKLEHMAITRYFDWFLTTPMMLVSMSSYFLYKKGERSAGEIAKKYKSQFVRILLSNLAMLIAGYLGEIGVIPKMSAVVIGTAAFIMTFRIIYKEMGGAGNNIFKLISLVWGLYGVAYVLPEAEKNVMYNALDVISKNFFAIFLVREISLSSINHL
jgi:bacteriorhodopsin